MIVSNWPYLDTADPVRPTIKGTTVKVMEVVMDRLAYDWNADEIQRQHPHLSLPQIHAALGYYYENREAFDRQIEEQLQRVDASREKLQNPALTAKLRAHRKTT